MTSVLMEIQNLNAWYDRKNLVLDNFSIQLLNHEAVGLIGLNGAGKTTFLKVLSGLLPTFRCAEIRFCGQPVAMRDRDFKLNRYTVFAEDASFSYFTFWEYLSYVFSAYGKDMPYLFVKSSVALNFT